MRALTGRLAFLLWGMALAWPAAGWAGEMGQSMEGFRFEETVHGRTIFAIESERARPGNYQWRFFRLRWKPVLYLENAAMTFYDARGKNSRVETHPLVMFDPAAKTFYHPDGTPLETWPPRS